MPILPITYSVIVSYLIMHKLSFTNEVRISGTITKSIVLFNRRKPSASVKITMGTIVQRNI